MVGREDVEGTLARAFELAEASPPGPVYVELGFRAATAEREPAMDGTHEPDRAAGDPGGGKTCGQ